MAAVEMKLKVTVQPRRFRAVRDGVHKLPCL